MLVSCWSAKGGVGTTVVATALALTLARGAPTGALLVDLDGDAPAVLGVPEPQSPGVGEWLAAGSDVPADGLARIEVRATPHLALLHRGGATVEPGASARAEVLAGLLAGESRPVVVDCGRLDGTPTPAAEVRRVLAASSTHSVLVTRGCYLALRRALALPLRPSSVVLVDEPGRSLGRLDVEEVLGVPVTAQIPWDPSVARAVDAGLLAGRLPRGLERAMRRAA
ncbi:MAG: hypothetical protein R2726_21455 [Acidimicrobiales bacterium]